MKSNDKLNKIFPKIRINKGSIIRFFFQILIKYGMTQGFSNLISSKNVQLITKEDKLQNNFIKKYQSKVFLVIYLTNIYKN